MKLDKPYLITEVDIGNEFSAIIEVLVANSLQDPPVFKELVLATSFMLISDATSEKNPNRVRMFNKELFIPEVRDQKWDLVKVVCTQTYNIRRQFGLSFVSLHSNEVEVKKNDDDESSGKEKVSSQHLKSSSSSSPAPSVKVSKSFGKFQFRDSISDSEDNSVSSPFSKWKNKRDSGNAPVQIASPANPTIKDQMKAKVDSELKRKRVINSSDEEDSQPVSKQKPDRNRAKGLMYDSDGDEPNEKLQKKLDMDREQKAKEQNSPKASNKFKLNSSTLSSPTPSSSKFSSFVNNDVPKLSAPSSSSNPSLPSNSRTQSDDSKNSNKSQLPKSPAKADKNQQYKKFDKLLDGVTFVLSGYQNPERGVIRQKAIDMGAKYKADWDRSCTHLV